MPPFPKLALKHKMERKRGSSDSEDPDYELPDDHHDDELPPPRRAGVRKRATTSTTRDSGLPARPSSSYIGEQNVDINVPTFLMNGSETQTLPQTNNILEEETFLTGTSSTLQHARGQVPQINNGNLDLPLQDGIHGSPDQAMSHSGNAGGISQPTRSSWEQTLQAIIDKRGDISKECYFKSEYVIVTMLEGICTGIQDIEGKTLEQLNISFLLKYDSFLEDAERMNFNVKWLRLHVAQLIDAVKSFAEAKEAENEKNELVEKIEDMEKEVQIQKEALQRLIVVVQGLERELDLKTTQREMMSAKISVLKARYESFSGEPLTIDELI